MSRGILTTTISSAARYVMLQTSVTQSKQGVALTGRNLTGPPCSVDRPRAWRPAGP